MFQHSLSHLVQGSGFRVQGSGFTVSGLICSRELS